MVCVFLISSVNITRSSVALNSSGMKHCLSLSLIAAMSERIRILIAPRLLISSILISVLILPVASNISRTWSDVTASNPHPKELSWTSSMSLRLEAKVAAA